MKRFLMITLACAAFAAAIPVYAYDAPHPKAKAQKNYTVKGEVIAVDKTAGKVKLRHEAIPELEWPVMTMFFTMADKSQLDALKIGDQVAFQFVKDKGVAPLITQIKSVK